MQLALRLRDEFTNQLLIRKERSINYVLLGY